ncbi:hypothetical protein [Nonomuraea sp. NPDC049158]|uniref:hypothetical protein n=1 Tax=Nonomuraea sp. NPDC049158 TaxID=3155649 RepID=UPI0033F10F27
MNIKKLAPALMATAVATALLSAPAVATADVAATHKKSAKCASPSGSKINISWGDGNVSTTVYFNNHCNQKRAINLQFVQENGKIFDKCITVNPKTKGKKKIGYSMPNKVTLPKSC